MHYLPNVMRNRLSPIVIFCAAFTLCGCGESDGGLPQADHDKAKDALEKALAAWKNGEPADKWSKKGAAIRFVDDAWARGDTLVTHEIVKIRANADHFPEAIVRLTTQSRDGKRSETEALYGINLTKADQISIGRDPMH